MLMENAYVNIKYGKRMPACFSHGQRCDLMELIVIAVEKRLIINGVAVPA